MKHLKYLKYVIRHKWFVFVACCRYGIVWRGLVHDLSKFRPSEWFPYVNYFYGTPYSNEESRQCFTATGGILPTLEDYKKAFDIAWLRHQQRNDHHWQNWILRNDDGTSVIIEMPRKCVLEMLADWEGAGRAINGGPQGSAETSRWYKKNYLRIQIHPRTRAFVNDKLLVDGPEEGAC